MISANLIQCLQFLLTIHRVQSSLTKSWLRLSQNTHALRIPRGSEINRTNAGSLQLRILILTLILNLLMDAVVCLYSRHLVLVVHAQLGRIHLVWLRLSDHFVLPERWWSIETLPNRIIDWLKGIIANHACLIIWDLSDSVIARLVQLGLVDGWVAVSEDVVVLVVVQVCVQILSFRTIQVLLVINVEGTTESHYFWFPNLNANKTKIILLENERKSMFICCI